jgi:hypothetical protein
MDHNQSWKPKMYFAQDDGWWQSLLAEEDRYGLPVRRGRPGGQKG